MFSTCLLLRLFGGPLCGKSELEDKKVDRDRFGGQSRRTNVRVVVLRNPQRRTLRSRTTTGGPYPRLPERRPAHASLTLRSPRIRIPTRVRTPTGYSNNQQ